MKTSRLIATLSLSAAIAAGVCGTVFAATPVVADGVLTGSKGMTLYVFDKDAVGSSKSVCNAACAANWPPFMTSADDAPSGDYSVVVRDDGGKQWAAKGKPLYYWVKDQKPGDRTGDGVNSVWHVATP